MLFSVSGLRFPRVSPVYRYCASSFNGASTSCSLSLLLKKHHFSRRIFIEKSSSHSAFSSLTVAASKKVLDPGGQGDASSPMTDQLESPSTISEDPQVIHNVDSEGMEDEKKIEVEEQESFPSVFSNNDEEAHAEEPSVPLHRNASTEKTEAKPRSIPPPGAGQKIYEIDSLLLGFRDHIDYRYAQYKKIRKEIDKYEGGLEVFSRGYEKLGFTRSETGITYREWAPGAKSAALIGDFNNWSPSADTMSQNEFGVWEIFLPNTADGSPAIPHGSRVKIRMETRSGVKDSIPAWIKFSVQAPGEIPYSGIYYDPPEEEKYVFKHPHPKRPKSLRIYESHVGMSSTEPVINTYANFRDNVLPRIKRLGYNAVQIMAIQEHSYYASFGYHVTNFFAPSSRFGTPDDLKSLIDRAHELGLLVLMDIVHS
ncbi:hypothetical protein ES332_A04G094700v1 [Gossypium tomentosum]|nr:hypothetical protein ES332_A04G094700v1 [Gossypium tomentosum]